MNGLPVWLSTMILGLGAVFLGLFILILIARLMSILCAKSEAKKTSKIKNEATPAAAVPAEIADRGAFYAAVSTSLASVMGKDVDGLRIVSIKKID